MKKLLLLLFISLVISSKPFAQDTIYRTLFIIDSIPLFSDPEPWNPISREDIADVTIINNKDSIKRLGWEDVGALAYVFTKAYRSRPDSIKRIPSLKQLQNRNTIWYWNDTPYTGKYIDYYNSGRIQNEGFLVDGIVSGELIIYRQNGNKKTVSHYKDGKLHGTSNDYYLKGALYSTRNYIDGRTVPYQTEYFINGQVKSEVRQKRKTMYDTAVYYYSGDRVKEMKLIINKVPIPNKKSEELNYYNPRFFQSINVGNLKEANKYFYKLWLIDSTSPDTHFKEGLLLLKEFRFDDAIKAFDEALLSEPLMCEALAHRALARLKKYKYANVNVFAKGFKETYFTVDDLSSISASELGKICSDLKMARDVDFTESYVQRVVPSLISNDCEKKK